MPGLLALRLLRDFSLLPLQQFPINLRGQFAQLLPVLLHRYLITQLLPQFRVLLHIVPRGLGSNGEDTPNPFRVQRKTPSHKKIFRSVRHPTKQSPRASLPSATGSLDCHPESSRAVCDWVPRCRPSLLPNSQYIIDQWGARIRMSRPSSTICTPVL